MAFADIAIVGLDEKASTREQGTDLFNLVLKLSAYAPSEWCDCFDSNWQYELYSMRRRAYASGNTIRILCVPSELKTEHLPHLQSVVNTANGTYKRYLAEVEAMEAKRKKKDTEDKAALAELGVDLFK
jgi:hypothetical protein